MMSGMLVPVSEFQTVDKAAQAIETLFGVDPEFVTLCKTLWGPDVDAVEVWRDTFAKDNPTGSDMSVPGSGFNNRRNRKRALEAAGIGATVIGGALGVKEVRNSVKEMREAKKLGHGSLWPKAKVAGVGAMLGGDAVATGMQVQAARRKQPVGKFSVGALANGFEAGFRKLPGIGGLAPKVSGKVAPRAKAIGSDLKRGATGQGMTPRNGPLLAVPKQPTAAYKTGQTMAGTPGRALATGAVGGVATGGALARRHNTAKRDTSMDVVWAGEFEKFDEDKRLVFGWASVVEVNGSPVVDRQGDYIHPDDLENASYEYVIKSRVGGDMHSRDGDVPLKVSDLVESVVVTPEKLRHMGIPEHVAKTMPVGWWVGFKVHSDDHWDMVKKRARAGFSIHGRGKRVPTNIDSLMPGYH